VTEIKLRQKYTCDKSVRSYHSHSDGTQKKHLHHALTERELELIALQPKKVLHLLASGKRRMEVR
jgi:hypothetical protein